MVTKKKRKKPKKPKKPKKRKKRVKLPSIKSLWDRAWALQSRFVRKAAADFSGYAPCYTCRKVFKWEELQSGHYIHGTLDFDLRNIHPQCPYCNHYLSGNLGLYAEHLILDLTAEGLTKLRSDAAHKGNKYSRQELLDIIEKYK